MEAEKKWADLTPAEKRQQRYDWWLNPGVKFASPEAEKSYASRAKRFIAAYQVEKPDRVPVSLPLGNWPAYLAGTDLKTVMYDYDKLSQAWKKYYGRYETDLAISPGMVLPARVYDLMDYKLYSWPGHGLPNTATGIQFVEGEYMREDEYDLLIKDPSDFWMRTYIPRVFGAFEPWKTLSPFTSIIEAPGAWFMPYTRPEMQAAAQKLIDLGKELSSWMKMLGEFGQWVQEAGYPAQRMMLAKAPFDTIGDTLRGTKGIIKDLFRRPEKLMEAIEVVTDFTIRQTIEAANANRAGNRVLPVAQRRRRLHVSEAIRKVLLAIAEEGRRRAGQRGHTDGTVRGRLLYDPAGNRQRIRQRRRRLAIRQDGYGKGQGNCRQDMLHLRERAVFVDGHRRAKTSERVLPKTYRGLRSGWRFYSRRRSPC